MANLPSQSESMLVKSENLDQLLLLAGKVIVASSGQEIVYKNLQALYDRKTAVDERTLDSAKDLMATTSLISADLHRLVQSIRTVTLKDFSFRARRLVRDIARKTGKRVHFEFEGEETTVDKAIVEQLYDPVSHQLRNAIDHGIEDSLTRSRNGKPEEGTIVLRAYNTERETFIEIEDDGAGVDLEALRTKSIEMGRLSPDAPFNEEEALRLMCMPGVSTVETVSEVSGRGVGMDVVLNHITDLGGTVSFTTERGRGSRFTFQVPLVSAVNIMDALVVQAGDYMLAFPIANVVASLSIPRKEVTGTFQKGRSIKYLGNLLPLHNLNRVLDGRPSSEDEETLRVIVVEHKGTRISFVVSEFFSPQKLVIIPFDEGLEVTGLVGTTVLGGRRLGFIVDVPALLQMAVGRSGGLGRREKTGAHPAGPTGAAEQEGPAPPGKEEAAPAALAPSAKAGPQTAEEEETEDAREFMVEVEKLVPGLNESIFVLESDPQNKEQINNAFRLLHTIKGNFIMMGLTKGGEAVHAVESVLDRVRGGELQLSPEVMDILMDGISYVEEAVRLSKTGQWTDEPAPNILEQSASLLPEKPSEEEMITDVASAEIQLSHEATYRAVYHQKNLTPFYQLFVEFDPGLQPSFLVACLIYKRACELGDVLGTVPKLEDIERGVMNGKLKLLLASCLDPEMLEKTLTSLLSEHYGAHRVAFTRFG